MNDYDGFNDNKNDPYRSNSIRLEVDPMLKEHESNKEFYRNLNN